MPSTIRNKIAQLREGKLTKSQKKLIDYFDNVDLRRVIYMSITDLAAATDVAEATVLRFCRSLGYNGYQEFRLNLAQGSTVLADEEPTDGRGTSYITEIANAIKPSTPHMRVPSPLPPPDCTSTGNCSTPCRTVFSPYTSASVLSAR